MRLVAAFTFAALLFPGIALATYPGDDGRIGFTRIVPPVPPGTYDLFTADPLGGGAKPFLATGDFETGLAFSPDGARAAYGQGPPATQRIYVASPDGSGAQPLTVGGPDGQPTFSPDGRRILFTSFRDGNGEIYVMNVDGSNQVNLTHHPDEDIDAVFSPDGQQIAFRTFREGNNEIYLMRFDGADVTNLTNNPGASDESPDFSPDGKLLAFDRDVGLGNFDVHVMDLATREVRNLTNSAASDGQPVFSPAGDRIVFTRDTGGIPIPDDLFAIGVDGSNVTPIVQDGAGTIDTPNVWESINLPPETSFTKRPKNKIRAHKTTYGIEANEPVEGFQCRIDKKPYKPCGETRKVKKLKSGKHRFRARAFDLLGVADDKPASDTFRVR